MVRNTDVVVVGAGPAGLTAALYTVRSKLETIVLEKMGPGGQLLNTELIEDYMGFKSITGQEMARVFEEHALEFGAQIEYGTVTEIYVDGHEKVILTEEGDEYRARAVIVCTGGIAKKLGIPGEIEHAGKGVSYCAICDGAFFRNHTIAVVGGGDAAVEEADFLTRYAAKVYLIHRRDEFRASKILQKRLFENKKVEVIWDTVVDRAEGDASGLTTLKLHNARANTRTDLEVTGLFVFVGFRPNTGIVA